ncbi:GRIP1-associated protein 1-like isoform X1 [Acropora palmata]|uniref:GRIP1-associated protein 1-like isoform X1 n=1 Tax=Acropora palmata TaxID=6131 RepID=UPI003DA10CDB
MASSLSDEEFSRMQAQLIELRTVNYELDVNCQRQQSELDQLQEKYTNQEKELQKQYKIINKSKNRKEYAILLEENEKLQGQFQAQEENFKLQNQTLLEEITKLNDENKALQKQVETKGGSQADPGADSEIRRLRAENAAFQKSLTSCQQRYEAELQQLREKLHSLSDEQDGSCQLGSTNENAQLSQEFQENGEQDSGLHSSESGGWSQTFKQKFHDILNRELLTFRDRMFASKAEDVSKEQEVNGRHDVAEVCENDPGASENNLEMESKESETCLDVGDNNQEFGKEIEKLKRKLIEDLTPLLASDDDFPVRSAFTRSPTRERLQEVEVKSVALEKQIKEMSGLQLQLDTEREEKRLLQEQLQDAKTSSKQDISKLEEELSKLTEKVKRKQESYLQLQEEKENLYSENKKSLEDLKSSKEEEIEILTQQMAKLQDTVNDTNKRYMELRGEAERQITNLEENIAAHQNQVSSSAEATEQMVTGLRKENALLTAEVEELRQKVKTAMVEQEESEDLISQLESKVSLSEDRCAELSMEVDELTAHVKEQTTAVDGWNEQISQLTSKRDELQDSLEEMSKVAEKRKGLLDEMAIEKQTAETNHKQQLEKLQEEHKKELSELREHLTGEKKLRKELEESQQKLSDVKAKLQSAESKNGWFERRLTEAEESLKEEKERSEQSLAALQAERESELAGLQEERVKETEEYQSQVCELQEQMEEKGQEMEKLRLELKDKEVENKIAGKKGDQLVKDLKRQLKLERKRAEQFQQKLQEALSENRVRPAVDDLFSPKEHQRSNSGDSSVLSMSRTDMDSPEFRPPSPTASTVSMLNDDTTDLIERLADVQQEKWQLEEKVRHLEENGAVLAEDLIQKSAIIQAYAMETKIGPIAESPKPSPVTISTLKEKIKSPFGKGKIESTRKIQLMLEETLTKNVQLQRDVDAMSKELQKMKQQEVEIPEVSQPEVNDSLDSNLNS